MKYLQSYNESVRDHLKPRSEEEINQSIDKVNAGVKEENLPNANLLTACTKGIFSLAKKAIEDGADVNLGDGVFLQSTAVYGYLDIAQLLLDNGADPTANNSYAYTLARFKGHKDVAELLKSKTGDSSNPLDVLFSKNESVRDKMIPKSEEELGEVLKNKTPKEQLEMGAELGDNWLVMKALENGADIHSDKDYALREAARKGYSDVVRTLLIKGADVHAKRDNALQLACHEYHMDVVKILLAFGADVHAEDDLAFRYARMYTDQDMISLLNKYRYKNTNESVRDQLRPRSKEAILKSFQGLSNSEKLDKIFELDISSIFTKEEFEEYLGELPSRDKLYFGCERGIKWLVEDAIKDGVDVTSWDNYAVRVACQTASMDIIKMLVDKGANIHDKKDVALSLTVDKGHVQVVKYLLDNGADINTYPNKENLKTASSRGYLEIVKMLLAAGSDVHYDNDAALQNACRYGQNPEIVKALIDSGADVHANNDRSLLMSVGHDSSYEVVKTLLENGADVNILFPRYEESKYNTRISALIKQYRDK